MKEKKPDGVVWDETQENYIAKLLPYASSISGPIIEVPNVDAFKKKGVDKVSKQFYSARFKFEPIVGETYHLYQGKKETFLSLIPPNQWKKEHLGTFLLNGDYKWERL